MANRRMFSSDVVATDKFLSLPSGAQALYYALSMAADDDGLTAAPRRIASLCGCGKTNLRVLEEQGYIISLSPTVIAITHWHVNNLIKADRYHETNFKAEKAMLELTGTTAKRSGGVYRLKGEAPEPERSENGDETEPQVRSGKVRSGKVREGKGSGSMPEAETVDSVCPAAQTDAPHDHHDLFPTPENIAAYAEERGYKLSPGEAGRFIDYNKLRGWTIGKKDILDWKIAFELWMKKGKEFENDGKNRNTPSVFICGGAEIPGDVVL